MSRDATGGELNPFRPVPKPTGGKRGDRRRVTYPAAKVKPKVRGEVALGPVPAELHQVPADVRARDQVLLSGLLDLVCMDPADMTPGQLRRARGHAGLTLAQAAKLLGVSPAVVMSLEAGRAELPEAEWAELMAKMGEVYGCEKAERPVMPWER
jgi:DNA-binding XRE family transcriptional regulator